MAIKRAPLCNKHKPRVYKDQCKQCRQEEMEATRAIYRPSIKEDTNDATTDDSTVAAESE